MRFALENVLAIRKTLCGGIGGSASRHGFRQRSEIAERENEKGAFNANAPSELGFLINSVMSMLLPKP